MPNIAILPDNLINKIAAGEVIERPASVVRELIDNSIDAGSTRIDIEILHGGRKLIKVSDNGAGMERADAVLCFERHATSKIKTEKELYDISTLGFRGEALAAIASVSKITLLTSTRNADVGTKLEIGPDRKKEIMDAPPTGGTTIEIRDIFYNTPARRKFLKTVPTEMSHIIETTVQKAFAYPGIAFSLRHNKSELLNAPAVKALKERFGQLYGNEMADESLEISAESKSIQVSGFCSSAELSRATRSHQFIFVNKRPVKNLTINHAVNDAYRDIIPGNRHPAYFLFLEIDPEKVDVNVHPAKREIRFERPDDIHRFVREAIYDALHPKKEGSTYLDTIPGEVDHSRQDYSFKERGRPFVSESPVQFNESQTDIFREGITAEISPFFYVGESFVATVTDRGLLILDQHAAHERINYEKYLKRTSIESEPLFLPLRIELPLKEYDIIVKRRELLSGLGLEIEDFGKNNVIVRSMPKELKKAEMKGLLLDVASGILEQETSGIRGGTGEEELLKNIAARLACHKSVRGSEYLNNEELSNMKLDLEKTDDPDRCPHGRPTSILLSMNDLQKMFKRK